MLRAVEKMPEAKGGTGPSLMKELNGTGESTNGNLLKNEDVESFEKSGYQKNKNRSVYYQKTILGEIS